MEENLFLYPLTMTQKRMLLLEWIYPGSTINNISGVCKVNGQLNLDALNQAINLFLKTNEGTRLRLTKQDGETMQYVEPFHNEQFPVVEFSTADEREFGIEKWIETRRQETFSLFHTPLYEFVILQFANQQFGLFIKFHHIIADGWSISLMSEQIFESYDRLLKGESIQDLDKPSFLIYAAKEQEYIHSARYERDRKYWNELFSSVQGSVLLKDSDSTSATRTTYYFDKRLSTAIKDITVCEGISVATFFIALYFIYLYKKERVSDLTIGTPVFNRSGKKERLIFGMTTNMMPFRHKVSGNSQAKLFLRTIHKELINCYSHQKYCCEWLIDDLELRKQGYDKLFQCSINYFNSNLFNSKFGEHGEIIWEEIGPGNVYLPLNLNIKEWQDGLFCLEIEYKTNVYSETEIHELYQALVQLASQIVNNPQQEVSELEIISSDEKQLILKSFNATDASYPSQNTLHQMFEDQVKRTPDSIAVIDDDVFMTYRELNARANRIAHELRAHGVRQDCLVGLLTERSIEMIVGIFGILKAGGAYVPLDPSYPKERIDFMLVDSGSQWLLGERHLLEGVKFTGVKLDLEELSSQGEEKENPAPLSNSNHLAYVIYTSGSTGMPKGVMVEHRSVVNRLVWMQERFPLRSDDVILQKTSFSFDVSVWELLWWSLYGAKVCLLPHGEEKYPAAIIETIRKHRVTVTHFVPSMLRIFLDHVDSGNRSVHLSSLKTVFASGEELLPGMVNHFRRSLRERNGTALINLYGPTEATIDVTYFPCDADSDITMVPIGRPIQNTRIYIVDVENRLQPRGVAGEICISGDGVARGYLNREELTADKFIADPFLPGGRMYRTGDLGRWLPDGNIEYLGRMDAQVKIRGYRIELGEVESALLQLKPVKEAAVVSVVDASGDNVLCAYIVCDGEPSVAELRTRLGEMLPTYMIPAHFMQLDKLPLTMNGKLDRKALPKPEKDAMRSTVYVGPRTEIEVRLVAIWQEALGVKRVGVTDDFFALGGHSLKAMQLISVIHQSLGIEIPLKRIFEHSTVEALALWIEHYASPQSYISISPAEQREHYPVSSAQKRLYILDQMGNHGTAYNMPGVFLLEGKVEPERLDAALRGLVQRHEILRTSFHWVDGAPVQRINEAADWEMEWIRGVELEEAVKTFIRPFDLSSGSLMRAALVQLEKNRYALLFDMHHIISDGVTLGILVREFGELYQGNELPELTIQYKDYACWQQEQVQTTRFQEQETYWTKQFDEAPPVLELPLDYGRKPVQSYAGSRIAVQEGAELLERLNNLARETGTTLFMVLLAAYKVLLSKYSGQEDVVVGTPIAGRTHAELQGMLGLFVNTLALRSRPEGALTFRSYLEQVKEVALAGYANQEYPFEELVEKVVKNRDLSRHPLFDTMFALQDQTQWSFSSQELRMVPYELENHYTKFDLAWMLAHNEDDLEIVIEYCTDLFQRDTVERMAKHYLHIVNAILSDPDIQLSRVSIITDEEKQEILKVFNSTSIPYPQDRTLSELFEEQVERTPDHIAIVCEAEQLTYRELNTRANRMAHRLRSQGVLPESVIGIMVEPSISMIIGVLGVLKAGGAFLPIDPSYPMERVNYMLNNGNSQYLLTQQSLLSVAERVFNGHIEVIDKPFEVNDACDNPPREASSRNMAYLIYTSGSTGLPKGIMVEHSSVVNLCQWYCRFYKITTEDRTIKYSGFAFDASVLDIFPTLLAGASLYIVPNEIRLDIAELYRFFEQNQITISFLPTAICERFIALVLQQGDSNLTLRTLITGGEKLQLPSIQGLDFEVFDNYGPAENTVISTSCNVRLTPGRIGKPIDNVQLLIINPNTLELLPIGIVGEICISGVGLARGYRGASESFANPFIQHPNAVDQRLYRTGDLGRWRQDGTIEYVGRMDNQVKIRGYRIELGEIESVLLELVDKAVASVWDDGQGSKLLCAYVVNRATITSDELRKHLAAKLPDFMIPQYYHILDDLPLTPNGKVDRNSLPKPDLNSLVNSEYIAPASSMEVLLAEIWKEVLKVEKVGLTDNFFQMGGDSIKAIQITSRLMKSQLKLSIKDLMQYPTIAQLVDHIKQASTPILQNAVVGEVELAPIQRWFFEQNFTQMHHWNQSVMLFCKEGFNEEKVRQVWSKIVEHHDALRITFTIESDRITQYNHDAANYELELSVHHLSGDDNEKRLYVTNVANLLQGSIELKNGPLVKLALFKESAGDHLLIIIHHLVVDGVSWRILLEDFFTGLEQANEHMPIRFEAKTNSYKEWVEHVKAYSQSTRFLMDEQYWERIGRQKIPPVLIPITPTLVSKVNSSQVITVGLDTETTHQLLFQIHNVYQTEINDILLAALGLVIYLQYGRNQFVIDLEGHGREEIGENINVTRTVGWFTSQFPVIIDLSKPEDIPYSIRQVREMLRKIPNKGIGFGILKYFIGRRFEMKSDISFNYLGQLSSDIYPISTYDKGMEQSLNSERTYKLDITGVIVEERLQMNFSYSTEQFEETEIQRLADGYKKCLLDIIDHCIARKDESPEYISNLDLDDALEIINLLE
ncbi:non-ribosomal peptide synthetase [Paenibacillus xylaniclasticus]|uniref:non-ribosomal peptide synthetase n=1 Tax=Paenibacillus xylaniclasticus TaxID=588083 RepID=UPI000FDAA278|nr:MULTISPECIES: non-ribosomal peptide synthetase [Paenibacillus]GFN33044.1 hypothetical protein PCURB6_33040 [Paenibacillus curdlanolyticus]